MSSLLQKASAIVAGLAIAAPVQAGFRAIRKGPVQTLQPQPHAGLSKGIGAENRTPNSRLRARAQAQFGYSHPQSSNAEPQKIVDSKGRELPVPELGELTVYQALLIEHPLQQIRDSLARAGIPLQENGNRLDHQIVDAFVQGHTKVGQYTMAHFTRDFALGKLAAGDLKEGNVDSFESSNLWIQSLGLAMIVAQFKRHAPLSAEAVQRMRQYMNSGAYQVFRPFMLHVTSYMSDIRRAEQTIRVKQKEERALQAEASAIAKARELIAYYEANGKNVTKGKILKELLNPIGWVKDGGLGAFDYATGGLRQVMKDRN